MKYVCDVCGYVMILPKAIPITESLRGRNSRIFLKIGYVLFAEQKNLIFLPMINDLLIC